jgi:replicative DNA helicase
MLKSRQVFTSKVYEITLDAEQALIGAILIDSAFSSNRKAISEVATILTPSDFLDERCGRIYEAMLKCQGPPHQINVGKQLVDSGKAQTGDISNMSLCISECPCSLDYLSYAKTIISYSGQRNPSFTKPIRTIEI